MANVRNALCLLITLVAGWNAVAQQITGSIRGTVVDPSGAVVQASVGQRKTNRDRSDACRKDGP